MKKFDYSILENKIKEYDKIIILAHASPDFDAMGSQLGLYLSLSKAFPTKQFIAGGECGLDIYKHNYTTLTAEEYKGALVIITDTAAPYLISDSNYVNGDYIIAIDHHSVGEQFADTSYIDASTISACLLIYDIIQSLDLYIDKDIANLLLMGIVADSGRFRYKNTDSLTFKVTSDLLEIGADLEYVYSLSERRLLDEVKYKGFVMNNFKIYKERIAYMINTKEMVADSKLSTFNVSRGMVSSMAEIEGIDAWVNFTETDEGILTEIRSKKIPVVSVAKSFGGGGHELACGATLASFDVVDGCLAKMYETVEQG